MMEQSAANRSQLRQLELDLAPAPPRAPVSEAALQDLARHLLREAGCVALAERVRVRWGPKLRTSAGRACYAQTLVLLNPCLLDCADGELDRTLRHELAHLLAHFRAGRQRIAPHGAEWQRACHDLGLPHEKRCHDLPWPRRRHRVRYVYRCPRCRREIRRVRPLRGRVACLSCCRLHNGGRYDDRFRLEKLPATML